MSGTIADLIGQTFGPLEVSRKNSGHAQGNKDQSDKQQKNKIYLQKYSTGIILAEAVILGDTSMFLQLKDNSEPVLGRNIDLNGLTIYPTELRSQLSEPYTFTSRDEIVYYLNLAKKLVNFDSIFRVVKTIYKKYVDVEDQYLTLLAADTIYSYFQDKLQLLTILFV